MTNTVEIPIFPLDTVLYPGGRLPLRIFEVRYVDMTKACIRDEAVFGVCQIVAGRETGVPAVPASIGCTARITSWEVPAAGLFSLVTRGENVFRIVEQHVQRDGLIRAQVVIEEPCQVHPLPSGWEPLGEMLGEIIQKIGPEHFDQPTRLDDAAWVAYRLAEVLPLSTERKLHLLQQRDARALLDEVGRVIQSMPA